MQTHYELLGLTPAADEQEVKAAWRRLARVHHPDRNTDDPDSVAHFQAIVGAYHVLSDPERRREYDGTLGVPLAGADGNGAAAPGEAPRRAKIPDRAICMTIPYSMNVDGGVLRILAPGVGRCAQCGGRGKVEGEPCHACEGSGCEIPPRTYPVWIAAGLLEGGTVRVPGAGWPSDHSGRGDLVVQLTLEDPPGMRREDTTVFTTTRVTRSQALLGGVATVETPDGPQKLRIPPQTADRTRFSLAGRGLRASAQAPRGDLIVTIEVH